MHEKTTTETRAARPRADLLRCSRRGLLGLAPVALAACTADPGDPPASGGRTTSPSDGGGVPEPVEGAGRFDLEAGTVLLNDGHVVPILGIGTFRLSDRRAAASVDTALAEGMRLADTARIYGNESAVGRGVRDSGIDREDVFVTTKLWTDDFGDAPAAIERSLARLDLDRIDLLLLHHAADEDEAAYRAMEQAVQAGTVRSIGLSNFDAEGVDRIMSMASIAPAVLQNETHPYHQNLELAEHLRSYGTVLEAWYPLGGRDDHDVLFADPTIAAIAEETGRTPAQTILRWHLQSGTVAIPGSSDDAHIAENAQVLDMELSQEQMDRIRALDRDERFSTY